MTTREWLIENMAQYPDSESLISECMEKMHVTRHNVTRMMARIRASASSAVKEAVPSGGLTSSGNVGIDGFRRLHDPDTTIPAKIRAAVNGALQKRGWMYEEEFRAETGLAKMDFYKYRMSQEFAEMRIRSKDPITKQEVYVWAHPSIAAEIRKIAVK